ncbi:hypothetical protein N431DRAFT_469085 [Stipitochalara longipes BDJ]|nr:hypothetical protein N431DRAFT_469085 [Stipitochalara longipes BDJ]
MQSYVHDLLNLFVSAVADHAYQIEAYWGFNPIKKLWVPLALTDPALLHSILFCSDQFGTRLNGQKERPSAVGHLRQTIRILNKRLLEPSQGISNSTIATVALLTLTEQSSNNRENWGIHMRGIKRMVDMRGGLLAFQCNLILHDMLSRADLWGSLDALSKPYLHMESRGVQATVRQVCNGKKKILAAGFQFLHEDFVFEPDFYEILCELHAVTQDINTPNPPKSEAVPLRLRESLLSIQYYLLSREEYNDISGSEDRLLKVCRLGIFTIRWHPPERILGPVD